MRLVCSVQIVAKSLLESAGRRLPIGRLRTAPTARAFAVVSVTSVYPAQLCIAHALIGTPCQFLALLAPCRMRCRAPLRLWLLKTVVFVPAVAASSP